MFEKLFSPSGLLDLPVVVMLAFFAVFLGVVAFVFARRRRGHYDEMARMPLNDD
jgi:cbb3-type cytochrome oxidase subunit 3